MQPSLAAALILFRVLLALPIGAVWSAWFSDGPAFHVASVIFCVPALVGLREVVHSFRRELLVLEKGDGGVAIRFRYRKSDASR